MCPAYIKEVGVPCGFQMSGFDWFNEVQPILFSKYFFLQINKRNKKFAVVNSQHTTVKYPRISSFEIHCSIHTHTHTHYILKKNN